MKETCTAAQVCVVPGCGLLQGRHAARQGGKLGTAKDADMSPFEAGRKLLSMESARLSLGDRIDLVFQDADLVPLLIQVGP